MESGWSIWSHPIPEGESVDQVGARARRVIDRALGAGDDVALFSHGHLLRILSAGWIGRPPSDGRLFALATASVSVLGWERETRVIEPGTWQSWNLAVSLPPSARREADHRARGDSAAGTAAYRQAGSRRAGPSSIR